jgi:hypothetical protein
VTTRRWTSVSETFSPAAWAFCRVRRLSLNTTRAHPNVRAGICCCPRAPLARRHRGAAVLHPGLLTLDDWLASGGADRIRELLSA